MDDLRAVLATGERPVVQRARKSQASVAQQAPTRVRVLAESASRLALAIVAMVRFIVLYDRPHDPEPFKCHYPELGIGVATDARMPSEVQILRWYLLFEVPRCNLGAAHQVPSEKLLPR